MIASSSDRGRPIRNEEQTMSGTQVLASLKSIAKNFGSQRALDDVSLDIRAGEVVAVVGENGAGKTTLVRILAGAMQPDGGQLSIRGVSVRLDSRKEGIEQGIGFVQQHYGLIDEFTGWQNYILGSPHHGVRLRTNAVRNRLKGLARELELDVDVDRPVSALSIGEKQRLETLLAVASKANVLILDEPTAALGPEDSVQLNRIIRKYVANGNAVIYISHKLHDVMEIATRIVVMRKGRVVASYDREVATLDQIAVDMVGRVVMSEAVARVQPGEPVLVLKDVGVATTKAYKGISAVNLTLHRREIVGVAGVVGSGQDALAELIVGHAAPNGGAVHLAPDVVGYVPEDRSGKGMAARLSVRHNLVVHSHRHREFRRAGALNWAGLRKHTRRLVEENDVSVHDIDGPIGRLSGGNQQKIVLIRELERKPDLLVAHNPYRGLDVGAIVKVRGELVRARDAGAAVLLISSDLDDLFDVCDRIVVLCDGRVTGEVDPRTVTEREVGRMMAGAA
jgi:simple sugar transport system ATP-binding protein